MDPSQASQSVTPTAFNIKLAGQNIAFGAAAFTTAPTLQFANGTLLGLNFVANTSRLIGFGYTSLGMSGWTVSAVVGATGQQLFATAAREPALVVDFASWVSPNTATDLTVQYTLVDGTEKLTLLEIPANATSSSAQALVCSLLKDYGLDVTVVGSTLLVKGTKNSQLKELYFNVANPPAGWKGPSFGGRVTTDDVSPKMFINDKEVSK